jgi:hypothetical protein
VAQRSAAAAKKRRKKLLKLGGLYSANNIPNENTARLEKAQKDRNVLNTNYSNEMKKSVCQIASGGLDDS